jgi:hypothetical protein
MTSLAQTATNGSRLAKLREFVRETRHGWLLAGAR